MRPLLPAARALAGRRLGAPGRVPARAHGLDRAPTYDLSGAPWFLVFGSAATTAATTGQQKVWAFRLEGREWQNRGSMTVAAVGQPAALPAPQSKDGVLAGTGLFSASGLPQPG